MALEYCVFWIPTNSHGDIKIQQDKEVPDIQIAADEVVQHSVRVQITRDCPLDKSVIEIFSTNSVTLESANLTLRYVDSSRNGLIVYVYEAPNDSSPEELRFIRRSLDLEIYHQIKGFFHKHQFHEGRYCSLDAYFSCYRPNIRKKDNPALKHYFQAYRNRFEGFRGLLEATFDTIEETQDEKLRWSRYKDFDKKCLDIFGEKLYYQALLSSKYNFSCHPIIPYSAKNTFDHELHRLAIETENILNEINLLHLKNSYKTHQEIAAMTFSHQAAIRLDIAALDASIKGVREIQVNLQESQDKSDKLSHNSYRIGVVGMVVGIVGILIGAYFSIVHPALFPSSQEKKIDQVMKVQHTQWQRINALESDHNVLDTLLKQSSEIHKRLCPRKKPGQARFQQAGRNTQQPVPVETRKAVLEK